jgi:hypothetical protein
MDRRWRTSGLALMLVASAFFCQAQTGALAAYLGFDRNDYPGDAALAALRKTFRYTSYWLNAPPGETANSWAGKRALLHQHGFGFLVLFNGRADAEIKAHAARGQDAKALGTADGKAAVAAAAREGFPPDVVIFLDQEEGGRLLPEQDAYLFAWIDAVRHGGTRAGIYCSGIDVPEGNGAINTARDIVEQETARAHSSSSPTPAGNNGEHPLVLWIADDQCPPAPGCTFAAPRLAGAFPRPVSDFTTVWQYAQSPRRLEFSASCTAKSAQDGKCYAPNLGPDAKIFVDLDVADSPDPSEMPDAGLSAKRGGEPAPLTAGSLRDREDY